jgi:hypothetical protein
MADTMLLVAAYCVEQDLQRAWREEREQQRGGATMDIMK